MSPDWVTAVTALILARRYFRHRKNKLFMEKILFALPVLVVRFSNKRFSNKFAIRKRLKMKLRGFTLAFMFVLLASFAFGQYPTPVPPVPPPSVPSAQMQATALYQRIAQQAGPGEVGVYSSNSFVSLVSPTTFTCPASREANPVASKCLVTVTVVAEMDNSDPRSTRNLRSFPHRYFA